MSRVERRHQSKGDVVRRLIKDFQAIAEIKKAIEGGWPFQPGDKVRLDIEKIMNDQEYKRKLQSYRTFCEMNADRVFTVEYIDGMNPSVVCFAEDESNPKWLFWTGDLKPAYPNWV